jgi:hypothetical protein
LEPSEEFKSFFTPLNQSKKKQEISETQITNFSENICNIPKAHIIKIKPVNIKTGLNGVLKKPLNLIIISDPKCRENKINISSTIKEASVSLIVLVISNYLQEILFSLMNNKDILDIIKYTQTQETEIFLKIDQLFNTFNCNNFLSLHSDWESFLSSVNIRARFLDNYETGLWSNLRKQDEKFWYLEYCKMFKRRYSKSILSGLNCKYNMILPEYTMLFFLGIFVIISLISNLWLHFEIMKAKPSLNKINTSKKIKNFFHSLFFNSLLFVYFYNLIAFCIMLKVVPTIGFGLIDYWIMIIRGAFVMYPLFNFLKEFNQKTKQINKKEKKIKKKKKKKKMQIKQTKMFTKRMPKKRIHGFWEQNHNTVKAFIRISFLNKNCQENDPAIKQKFFKYNLEIIEDKNPQKIIKRKKPSN